MRNVTKSYSKHIWSQMVCSKIGSVISHIDISKTSQYNSFIHVLKYILIYLSGVSSRKSSNNFF